MLSNDTDEVELYIRRVYFVAALAHLTISYDHNLQMEVFFKFIFFCEQFLSDLA